MNFLSRSNASLLVAVSLLATPAIARAEAPLISGFGGVAGFGTQCLSPNDDGSSDPIDLRPAFPMGLRFFAGQFTSVFVNTNGNITFNGALSVYTPDPFPVASQPMIAPYWADVDIRPGDGSCGGIGPGVSPGNLMCRNPRSNGVWWHLDPGRMIVTWDRVGYFGCHTDRLMSFQLVLTDASACGGPGDFDVEFRYNVCNWTTGDASGGNGGFGGTPAQAGFDAGDNMNFVVIPGSRMNDINTRLCGGSTVGQPGIWRFGIRSGVITTGPGTQTCGVGACVRTSPICDNGNMVACQPGLPTSEVCNGSDDDCNGTVDDGEQHCGVGACRRSAPLCTADGRPAECSPGSPRREICFNGVDDDCDNFIDEGCGTDVMAYDASDDAPAVVCRDPRCLLLEGRAGPVGECTCRVPAGDRPRRGSLGVMAILAVACAMRRSRRAARA